MSITHTTSSQTINAQEEIAEATRKFLESGGIIEKIPTGKSSEDLTLVKNKSGTMRYADKKNQMKVMEKARLDKRMGVKS